MKWLNSDVGNNYFNICLGKVIKQEIKNFPINCPICKSKNSVHMYIHSRGQKKIGGAWIWCSSCHNHMHGSIIAPSWWKNLPIIKESDLYAQPDILEMHITEIDNHWNTINIPAD